MTARDDYVLRDKDREEIARLEFQHQVWQGPTQAALDRAGFGSGDVVAELGCGPGFLAVELSRRVGSEGRVLGIDSSELFIRRLRDRANREGITWLEGRVGDIRNEFAKPGSLDGVVCRWVLMFVPEPERAIGQVAVALRPGGTFLALEYFQFGTIALHPEGEAFARTYAAVHRLITDAGGDPDLGGRLPYLLERSGLEVVEVRAVLRVARPGEPVWRWLEATHRNHSNLVEAGCLSPAELEEYYREWDRARSRPGAFLTAPPLLAVVARKAT